MEEKFHIIDNPASADLKPIAVTSNKSDGQLIIKEQ